MGRSSLASTLLLSVTRIPFYAGRTGSFIGSGRPACGRQCGVQVERHQLAPCERASQPRCPLEVPAGVFAALQLLHERAPGVPGLLWEEQTQNPGSELGPWGSDIYYPLALYPRGRYRYSYYSDEDWKSG